MTKTYASNEKPLPVKTVAVKHMEIVDDFVQVTLSWTPGKGMQVSLTISS